MRYLQNHSCPILLLGLLFCIVLTSCTAEPAVYGSPIAEQDGWVYYTTYGRNLCKIRTDGTEETKLTDDYCEKITVVGDWIYYTHNTNPDDYPYFHRYVLYKMRTDGTEKTKLTDGHWDFTVIGDWIYYTTYSRNLCKIRTDGTEETILNDDYCRNFTVIGDWIYYTHDIDPDNYSDINRYDLYKIRTDGTEKTKLDDDYCENITVVGDWIYYTKHYKDGLYRVRTDGTEKTKLDDREKYASPFEVAGDWVYCRSGAYLYRIRTDGTEETVLDTDDLGEFYSNRGSYEISGVGFDFDVEGDWIYYTRVTAGIMYSANSNRRQFLYSLYKIRTDGTEKTRLNEEVGGYHDMHVEGDWIYYNGNYKIRTDGTEAQSTNQLFWIFVG